MNIVEKEAEIFYDKLYRIGKEINLENLKAHITDRLSNFNRDRDQLDFLKILFQKNIKDKEEHAKTCTGCPYDEKREIGSFAINQEIDRINRSYIYEVNIDDEFSVEQDSELHNKLNNILEKLERQGIGQEIIYEEIEDLKNHFNLGKKNWFQLLKGKLIDMTIKKVLDKTIVQEIYSELSEGFEQVVKMIG